ncbi:phosphoesterase [Moelleriella libera RCEF 2490]|uniref:Phosphoesterase n=1 Tax=Moelleriella libera RCEF 2490 TaxID=1081109 RepID=A0A168EPM4_9HYPO|nr:phosphoesterase [Moelleriella libera RCEF 2490]
MPKTSSIRIVCISDTHNKQPILPFGDILIHAGDLTENGSFEEVQNGLTWLSSQPHKYKIFVAGNHDVLLDDVFLKNHPERRYGQRKTKQDLDWGSVIYLQDSFIILELPASQQQQPSVRSITIFGSPWTPRYGNSAFQYHPNNSQHWEDTFACLDTKPHIVVTHGPPHLHLDRRDFHRAGCPYLAEEVYRIRPRLHVFGHIHASYGREDVTLDSVQRMYEEVMRGWVGWAGIIWMVTLVWWARVKHIFRQPEEDKKMTFINAAVVGGPHNELQNAPITIDL